MAFEPTHAVAVTGYVFHEGRFLLLKRNTPPLIWAPPGGRLGPNEDPRSGAVREVLEETGLETRLVGMVDYWFGEIADRGVLLSLDFLLVPDGPPEVRLSDEHCEFCWASVADLLCGRPDLGRDPWCYRLEHFQAALHFLQNRPTDQQIQ